MPFGRSCLLPCPPIQLARRASAEVPSTRHPQPPPEQLAQSSDMIECQVWSWQLERLSASEQMRRRGEECLHAGRQHRPIVAREARHRQLIALFLAAQENHDQNNARFLSEVDADRTRNRTAEDRIALAPSSSLQGASASGPILRGYRGRARWRN